MNIIDDYINAIKAQEDVMDVLVTDYTYDAEAEEYHIGVSILRKTPLEYITIDFSMIE